MEEDDYLKLPTDEKCQHKLWKARVTGYEEATKLFQTATDPKSPEFSKFLPLVRKFVVDSNAVAQEKGLVAVLAFVENAGCAGRICGDVMNGLVTKCIGAPKQKTREAAIEITLMYVEIEKQEVVQDELIKGLENKSPKVVSGCCFTLKECLRCFGPKIVTLKPLVKVIPKLLEDRDKGVREEGKQLTIELYRWIKDALKPQLQSLKPVQISELEAEFEKISSEIAVPERYIRSEQEKRAQAAAQGGGEEEESEAAVDEVPIVDAYELIEAVDILSKLPKDFYELCEAKKWQERKEALDKLQELVNSPKLESGDYGDLVRTLKRMISKDANVIIVGIAAQCLAKLAGGLRKRFQPYANSCVPVIIEKLKEKKLNVLQPLREAMDNVYQATTLEAILEDIQGALDNKNPQIRSETVAFLGRAFSKATQTTLNKKILKLLMPALIKTLNDSDPSVRDNSAMAIGTALKVVGERNLLPFLADVDQLKMDKIKDCCEKAEVVAPQPTPRLKPAPKQVSSAASAPRARSPAVSEVDSKPAPPAVKKIASGTAPGKARSAPTNKAPTRQQSAPASKKGGDTSKQEFTERDLSEDEVTAQASNLFPDDVINGLVSANWKERLAAVERMKELVQNFEKADIPALVTVRVLSRKPGFRDTNFQVLKLKFELLTHIAESAKISRYTLDACLPDLVDKIGDIKTGSSAGLALSALAEATSLETVSHEVLHLSFAQKNPKNQSESLNWLANSIKEFGLKVPVKIVIDHLKKAFSATNPGVRTAAISLTGVMYLYMGKTLRTFFEDEKAALVQQLDTEFAKLEDVKPPAPTRGVPVKNIDGDGGGDAGDAENYGSGVNVADLIPRTDISNQITESLIAELMDKNWKTRAEGLQKLSAIINEAKFITPELRDLPPVLKARMLDSNKNLAIQAIGICQTLGQAMGPQCNKHVRNFSPGMFSALGDNKNTVRNASLACLNTWAEQCPLACFFEGEAVCDGLKAENPNLRIELFGWLSEKLQATKSLPAAELAPCIPYLYSCLEDRNAEVRKRAQDCLLPFMLHLGYDSMTRATSKLKPTNKSMVMAQLEKLRPQLPTKIPPKGKATILRGGSAPAAASSAKSGPSPGVSSENLAGAAEDDAASRSKMKKSSSKTRLAPKAAGGTSKSGKKDEEQDNSPPLIANNMKEQRFAEEKALRVLKWNFTSPREEFYVQLKDQMTSANWGRTLINYCFHADFKFHIKAIDILIECLPQNIDATIANLDLILKWLALRFFDTNPSVLLKGLEYLQSMFSLLQDAGYRLHDVEASSFIPYIILKTGDPKDTVRKGVKEIFKLLCSIYPASKFFPYIMQGLPSKNARQRAECLEEIGYLIEMFGIVVCLPSPAVALKEVAKHIADRDNSVRNAALNCVVQAYFLEGEKVYKLVGQLSDKDMSLLEERIKRASKSKPPPSVQQEEPRHMSAIRPPTAPATNRTSKTDSAEEVQRRPTKSETPRPRSMGPLTLETHDIEQMFKQDRKVPAPGLIEVNADEILNLPDIQLPQTRIRPQTAPMRLLGNSAEAAVALNVVMAQLAAQEIPVAVEAFTQVEEVLRHEEKALAVLGPKVDQLLVMGAVQYRFAHTRHMADETICKADVIKLYRWVTATLLALFEFSSLAKKASRDVLRDLIPQLITVMLDSRLNELQEGPQVIRSINLLMVRMLQKANSTYAMSALIKLLHDCVGNPNSLNASEKYTELVMKCLWKMLRMTDSFINELSLDRILLDLHLFLKAYPSSFWKGRDHDTPIRTVKTIIYTLIKHKGDEVLNHAMTVPNKEDSDLCHYVQKMLKVHSKKEGKKEELVCLSESPETMRKSAKSKSFRLTKSSGAISDIFKKIGTKEYTKEGLVELYEFKQKHPDIDIEPFLQRSSEFFQNYIRRGLKDIEKERGNSHIGASAPSLVAHVLPLQNDSNRENYSENGTTEMIPALPPNFMENTALDWAEWLKSVAARLGQDGSELDSPEFLARMMPNYDEESVQFLVEESQRIADAAEQIVEDYKVTMKIK